MAYKQSNQNGQATMANSEPVVIASDQSAVPVSGTVTANLSAADNAVLDAIEADTTTIAAKDFATQTTLAAINTKLVSGTDIGDVTINNAAGASAVNIQDGGNTITVDGTVAVTNAGLTALNGAIAGTEVQVDVLTMPTVAVTQSGTWDEVGINDSGNSITVDAPVGTPAFVRLSDGAAAITTLPVSLASVPSHAVTNAGTFVTQESGALLTAAQLMDDVVFADDAAFTLGTHKGGVIAGIAVETDGTDPTSVSAEGDASAVRTDRNRRLLVNDMHPNSFVLFEDHTSAQTNNQLKAAPGAGLSIYITDVIISNGAVAGSLKLVEDEGGTPVQISQTVYVAITGGAVMNFKTPKRLTANKSLGFTSATVTTYSIEIHGYIAP